jgi:hypothetical protein
MKREEKLYVFRTLLEPLEFGDDGLPIRPGSEEFANVGFVAVTEKGIAHIEERLTALLGCEVFDEDQSVYISAPEGECFYYSLEDGLQESFPFNEEARFIRLDLPHRHASFIAIEKGTGAKLLASLFLIGKNGKRQILTDWVEAGAEEEKAG